MAGTIIMDLLFQDKILLENGIVKIKSESLPGNPILDDALLEMITYRKDKDCKILGKQDKFQS